MLHEAVAGRVEQCGYSGYSGAYSVRMGARRSVMARVQRSLDILGLAAVGWMPNVRINSYACIPFHSIPFHSIPVHSIPFHSIPPSYHPSIPASVAAVHPGTAAQEVRHRLPTRRAEPVLLPSHLPQGVDELCLAIFVDRLSGFLHYIPRPSSKILLVCVCRQ